VARVAALDPALDGLEPTDMVVDAARHVLDARLKLVGKLLAAARDGGADEAECVHQLRVATRRAAAALFVFESDASRRWARMRKRLRRIRRAADAARRCDVHHEILLADAESAAERLRAGMRAVADWLAADRPKATRAVEAIARQHGRAEFKRARRSLLASLRDGRDDSAVGQAEQPRLLHHAAAEILPHLVGDLRAASRTDLRKFENLHAMRLTGKRLRYAMEIFSSCITPTARETLYPALKHMQDQLGQINDSHEIVERVSELLTICDEKRPPRVIREALGEDTPRRLLVEIQRRYERQRQRRTREFLRWCRSIEGESLLVDLSRAADRSDADGGPGGQEAAAATATTSHHTVPRYAAIDVGTNSIRLVVAEASDNGAYRVIDDEKETTRLGRGLFASGRLTMSAMKRSVRAIARMKQIAQAYHVDVLRAVGTAAVREAVNGDEFVELVRHRTGIDVELISAESEARLAYSSVANAFDITSIDVAVVDIGGGSTEVVLASSGVIDEVCTLALGAVRLSDMFGGKPEQPEAFAAMREHVDATLNASLGAVRQPPDVMIGTGGTFTTLAKIMLRRDAEDGHEGRFPFDLRGFELTLEQVQEVLAELRSMPLRERGRVPGVSVSRAEIIVEGVTIVERLMVRLGAKRLRVHDGGIRDGLLAQMIEDHGFGAAGGPSMASDRLKQVRRFAEACRYDRHHAIQVARLALRIFDQLVRHAPAAGPACDAAWGGSANRELLHMAALLHDVGCCIEYRRHHKHSYDLIVGSRLPDFSRREIELIANIGRYHRKAAPRARHRNFARLSDHDQRVVLHLAAILRVADGLDRSHAQVVRGVRAEPGGATAIFEVEADAEPAAELRAAARKADVFEDVFQVGAEIRWCGAPQRVGALQGGRRGA
jgi:exopolyphosphatase/guanosine-5'-triphosphate,3'-diphosphate pyrophosphatase